jgi:hypothetical protein
MESSDEKAPALSTAAERILQRLSSSDPTDQAFVAGLRALAEKARRGDARRMFNASLSVVSHLGLAGDERTIERVKAHFGRKGYVEKRPSAWRLTIIWTRPAGDPLLIVAHAWMALAFTVEEYLRIYDAKGSLSAIAQELDAIALRVEISQAYLVSLPKGNPTKTKINPIRPRITMTPPQVEFRRTPGSMRQTFPQRYPGRFLEGGAPGLGKRA